MGKPKKNLTPVKRIDNKRRSKHLMKLDSVITVATGNKQYEDCETSTVKKAAKLDQNEIQNGFLYEEENMNGTTENNNNNNEELFENVFLLSSISPLKNTHEMFDERSDSDKTKENQEDDEVGYDLVLEKLKRQLCRLCGRKQASLLPIFGTCFENEVPISEKIQMHLPLEIKADDSLPHNICESCSAIVKAWHDLHVSCVAADVVLHRTFMKARDNYNSEHHLDNLEKSLGSDLDQPQENSFTITAEMENEVQGGSVKKLLENNEDIESDYDLTDSWKIKSSECYEDIESFSNKQQCESQQAMCDLCGICVKQQNLRNHIRKVHTKTMLCETCGKFFSWYNFKTHRGECVLDPIRFCEHCSRVFFTEEGYEVHMQEHVQGINQVLRMKIKASIQDELSLVYYCPVCGNSYRDKISVIVHLNANKIVTCRPCNKVFSNERAFLTHIHTPNQAFWHCHYCFQTFKRKYSWQIHERTHSHQNRLYRCVICGKQYPSIENLLQHILCHRSNSYFCAPCNMKFSRQSTLKEHVLQHEGFVHKCKSCGMQFQSLRSLRLHKAKVHRKRILFQKQEA